MKIEIKKVNIEKIIYTNQCNENETKSSPHPDWLLPGILHNILLRQVIHALPSLNIKTEKAQEIIKKELIRLNNELELGYNEKHIANLNFLPPPGQDLLDYFLDILRNGGTGPYNPEPFIVEGYFSLVKILENNKENLDQAAKEIKSYYKENKNMAEDKQLFTNLMSTAYHSAKLYSKKENRMQLLRISDDPEDLKKEASINWWKVAGCDAFGALGGGVGAVAASGCSVVMQW